METMRAGAEPILAEEGGGPVDSRPTLHHAIERMQAMITHLEDRLGSVLDPNESLAAIDHTPETKISALGDRILSLEAQTERLSRLIARLDLRV
jgi:hypothetical protein